MGRLIAAVVACVLQLSWAEKVTVSFADVPPETRARLGRAGADAAAFGSFVDAVNRRTADRSAAADREHLAYFVLQSTRLTAAPSIEPAVSAKAFVASGESAIPRDAAKRIDAFIETQHDGGDERLRHFLSVLPPGDRESKRRFVEQSYRDAMRFLYQKEFATPRDKVAELYQERGTSTDTAMEASYPVDQALRLIARLAPSTRLHHVLIVGPGLDLAPRTDLVDTMPPQSFQPFAVADTLLATGLAQADVLRVHSVDISDTVIRYLVAVGEGRVSRVFVFPGLAEHPGRRWSDDFQRYLAAFGAHIGNPLGGSAPGEGGQHVRTLHLNEAIARRLTADRMNVITERYRTSGQFDAVVATNVFPYFSDPELALALANLAHALRSGGYLVHNEGRHGFPTLAEAAGFLPVQARGIAIAEGPSGRVADAIWIHRRR